MQKCMGFVISKNLRLKWRFLDITINPGTGRDFYYRFGPSCYVAFLAMLEFYTSTCDPVLPVFSIAEAKDMAPTVEAKKSPVEGLFS